MNKKMKKSSQLQENTWGGGILNKNPDRLERFTKNKNQKKIIIGSIIGLILLIGGITLYRTFALYEEKKEFDVLKGVVPDFSSMLQDSLKKIITVKGKSASAFPSKAITYNVTITCDKGASGTWNKTTWNYTINNLSAKDTTCNFYFNATKTHTIVSKVSNTSVKISSYRGNTLVKEAVASANGVTVSDANGILTIYYTSGGSWRLEGQNDNPVYINGGLANGFNIAHPASTFSTYYFELR